MKKIIWVFLTLALISAPSVVYSQDTQKTKQEQKESKKREKEENDKKKKEEKERKKKENEGKPKWAGLPEKMSGIPEVDLYIITVDSIYTNVNNYTDRINFYTQKTVPLLNLNGEQIKDENGQGYVKTEITDENGNIVSITQLLIQLPDITVSLIGLTGEATNILGQGISATLAFSSNPLAAFTYGKYLKDGPKLLGHIGQEGARLISITQKQYAVLTKLRESEATVDFGLDINRDEAIINLEKDYAEATGVDDILRDLEKSEDLGILD